MSAWKPGDVAVAVHPLKDDGVVRGIIDTDGRFYTTDQSVKGVSSSAFAVSSLRPLVVIDPEDREQVERLNDAIDVVGYHHDFVDRLQAALREFATPTPPPIEEPTGWLAVVKDQSGVEWYRWSVRPKDREQAWISVYDEGRCYPTAYADIAVVRVLSEGVTA